MEFAEPWPPRMRTSAALVELMTPVRIPVLLYELILALPSIRTLPVTVAPSRRIAPRPMVEPKPRTAAEVPL